MSDFDLFVSPLHRQVRKEKELKSLLWKIDFAEIKFGRSDLEYFGTPMDDEPPMCVRHKLLYCRHHHELKNILKQNARKKIARNTFRFCHCVDGKFHLFANAHA